MTLFRFNVLGIPGFCNSGCRRWGKIEYGRWENFSREKFSQPFRRKMARVRIYNLSLLLLVPLVGCTQNLPPIRVQLGMGDPAPALTLRGLVAAGEPEAALVAKDILAVRGNAADAAVALAMTLAVTLPSRAGLAAGGECLVRDPVRRQVETLTFGRGDAGAGAPTLPSGIFALHARLGKLPWAQVVAPAEQRARFGVMVSRALARDLEVHGTVLIDDRTAFLQFSSPRRQLMAIGEILRQPQLAATLGAIRQRQPQAAADTLWTPAIRRDIGGADVYITTAKDNDTAGKDIATAFTVADADGLLVSCGLSMGPPFGRGRMAGDGGYFQAVSGTSGGLGLAIVMNGDTGETRAAVAGLASSVASFADVAAAGRRRLPEIKATIAKGTGALPAAAWACPSGLQTDGRACESFVQPDSAGYALVVLPEDR